MKRKNCLQKHRLQLPLTQEIFSLLTWGEVISAAGWRSGDGDEVKHDADGSVAPLLGLKQQMLVQVFCLHTADAELFMVVENSSWCSKENNMIKYWWTE